MTVLGHAYRNDTEDRLLSDMENHLNLMVSSLDRKIQSLENNMKFIASLDVMDDLLTMDLDRRILSLLISRKQDLQLDGDFFVTNLESVVIASSAPEEIGRAFEGTPFLTVPVMSSFEERTIGYLHVNYENTNLTRLFSDDRNLHFTLVASGHREADDTALVNSLVVEKSLVTRPEMSVLLEQDREFAFSALSDLSGRLFLALAFGVIAIVSVAYLVAGYMIKPVTNLANAARKITETQDYSQRVDVDRADEIGQLSAAFNHMLSGIQQALERLREESINQLRLVEEKSRSEMLQTLSNKLSKYLSPQIYQSIFKGEKDVTLGSSRKKLTIFFSDIVSFTDTTDRMESEDLTQLLNQYLSEMTVIALEYGATIDKYIGDAIMIFFGDPQTLGVPEDAQQCLKMAMAMQERVHELKSEWRNAGYTSPFEIRIGIHTGYCTVGNFGTEARMDYTIVGSAVNLASRIESAAEPSTIYLSEDTYLLVKEQIPCISVKTFTPKGFHEPVKLYKAVFQHPGAGEVTILEERGLNLVFDPALISDKGKDQLKQFLKKLTDEGS
ncbi:HAMP domain-containing protein [Alcanivorax sp. 1008]|nr:HAMP domain-containing protein [Alcanivorax sp. 1008]